MASGFYSERSQRIPFIAGRSDALAYAVSYTELYRTVKAMVEGERYRMLEAVAEAVAQRVLASFPVSAVQRCG